MSSASSPHTLLALKVATKSRSISEKQASDRQRDCLVLILQFLRQFGYVSTAAQFQSEAGNIFSKYESADNIDLPQLVADYEDFCEMKFGRKPKFSRPIATQQIPPIAIMVVVVEVAHVKKAHDF